MESGVVGPNYLKKSSHVKGVSVNKPFIDMLVILTWQMFSLNSKCIQYIISANKESLVIKFAISCM